MIDGGLISDGTLQTGPNGNAAAFGPMPVAPSKLSSIAKPSAPFEILLRRASVYGLLNHLRASGVVIDRVRELNPMPENALVPFQEWQDDCADALAQVFISTISVVDLEAIVIDGLLPGDLLSQTVDLVRTRFKAMMPKGLVAPEIIACAIGPHASALGAAILPIYQLFAPDGAVLTKKTVEKKPLMIKLLG